ncbi:hypothetical protein AVEN_149882-1 [Araneus ventricosus]|uniref:Uncharacterized protein n=1 Tax=Araneus ventricosus TaxID=182803 RepID=A0A4Y2E093_ARAVE|nr:hypothetical protein AVEN_149882-1 [Araneus ventricosus]
MIVERILPCKIFGAKLNAWFGRKLRYAERNRETPIECETISKLSEKFYSGLTCAKGETPEQRRFQKRNVFQSRDRLNKEIERLFLSIWQEIIMLGIKALVPGVYILKTEEISLL